MKKRLLSLVVLALSLAACGQTVAPVTPPPTQPPVPTVPVMFWHGDPGEDWPQSFEEAVPRAELVVLADVVSVKQGPDWVGNPEVNDRHPTQRIKLHVVKAYKGTVGQGEDLVLFQGGNGLYQGHISVQEQVLMVNENDPLYQAGERYLLALQPLDALVPEEVRQWQPQPWQAGMVQTLWSGRLLVNQDGTVTGVVADAAGRATPGDTISKTLEEFEARIAAARTATPTAAGVTTTAIAATPTVIRGESPATVESEAVPEEGYVDPLAEVEWVLKATLPEEPVTASVFRLPAPDKPTVAEVRQLATQFGLPGEIYIQEPLTDYHLFGVTQTLSVSDVPGGAQTQIYYRPVSDEDYDPANLLPFDQAAPIATAFLTERGLLDFPYQVVPVPYYVVPVQYYSDYSVPQFLRLVEGRPVVAPSELTVAVDTAGRVFSIAYFPLPPLIPLGKYPLLSAPEAWSRIQAGTSEAFYSNFYPAVPQAVEAPPTAWGRTYRVGQQADLYGYITVYRPAEGDGPPRLEIGTSLGTFWLQGTEAELRAIAAHTQEIIHAWGTTVKDIPRPWALELTGWEVIPRAPEVPSLAGIAGTIQRADGQTLLLTDTGQTLLLPDAPADLPDGYGVRVTGWTIEPADGPYPVFEWEFIERYEAGATVVAPDTGDLLRAIRQVVITEVDLVYDYQSGAYTGATDSDGLELNLLLPAWRFTGTTDASDKIEFIAQAVAAELVQPK